MHSLLKGNPAGGNSEYKMTGKNNFLKRQETFSAAAAEKNTSNAKVTSYTSLPIKHGRNWLVNINAIMMQE